MKKVAWIVGGATGLGVMIAKGLAEDGYHIAINYRNSKEKAEKLGEEIKNYGTEVLIMQGDVRNFTEVKKLVQKIVEYFGRIDVLICTAGPFLFQPVLLADTSEEQWRDMLDGNLSSVYACIKETLPLMRKQGWGRIITFGFSEAEQAPAWPGYAAYAAAKVGLVSLTRSLAREEAAHGITVNMICPGDIRHPYKESTIQEARGKTDYRTPIGRPGTGEDIARVIRFLVDPQSDFITGAIIPVTGGFAQTGKIL
jgi:3-oxoacyl-[acyl-carrier protein] reductase